MMARKNTAEDVFRYINTHGNDPTVCWEWTGYLAGKEGRPYFTIDYKQQLAYRVVFNLFNSPPLQPHEVVRHKVCDNPICCNPTHLARGTRSDNEFDKYQADRAGIPKDIVREIKRLSQFDMSNPAIRKYLTDKHEITVSLTAIQRIRTGQRRAKDDD
jgi:hypothetical protein